MFFLKKKKQVKTKLIKAFHPPVIMSSQVAFMSSLKKKGKFSISQEKKTKAVTKQMPYIDMLKKQLFFKNRWVNFFLKESYWKLLRRVLPLLYHLEKLNHKFHQLLDFWKNNLWHAKPRRRREVKTQTTLTRNLFTNTNWTQAAILTNEKLNYKQLQNNCWLFSQLYFKKRKVFQWERKKN